MPATSNAVMAACGAVILRFQGVANLLSIKLCFNGPLETTCHVATSGREGVTWLGGCVLYEIDGRESLTLTMPSPCHDVLLRL
jgi:hypothetical protein